MIKKIKLFALLLIIIFSIFSTINAYVITIKYARDYSNIVSALKSIDLSQNKTITNDGYSYRVGNFYYKDKLEIDYNVVRICDNKETKVFGYIRVCTENKTNYVVTDNVSRNL